MSGNSSQPAPADWPHPSYESFFFFKRGRALRRRSAAETLSRVRSDGRMAELVSFAVPTETDKTLLVWELSSGPTAEDLHVSRARMEGGGYGESRVSPHSLTR